MIDVLDLLVLEPDAVDRVADHERAELGRLVAGEAAAELAERRPDGADDHGSGHGVRVTMAVMVARASPTGSRAFGLPLLGALLVLVASLWAFGAIAEELLEDDTQHDQRLADWLHGRATDRSPTSSAGSRGSATSRRCSRSRCSRSGISLAPARAHGRRLRRARLPRRAGALERDEARLPARAAVLPRPARDREHVLVPERPRAVSLAVYGSIALVLAQRAADPAAQRPGVLGRSRGSVARDRLQPPLPRRALPLGRARRASPPGAAWLALLYLALEAQVALHLAVPGLDERVEPEREQPGGHQPEQERAVRACAELARARRRSRPLPSGRTGRRRGRGRRRSARRRRRGPRSRTTPITVYALSSASLSLRSLSFSRNLRVTPR